MISKCPGQDDRNIKAEEIRCPACGCNIEIFSDEVKARCPKCKIFAYRKRMPSCIDWCSFARECIGENKWKETKGG